MSRSAAQVVTLLLFYGSVCLHAQPASVYCHTSGLKCFTSELWKSGGTQWAIVTFHGPQTFEAAFAVAKDIHKQNPKLSFYIIDTIATATFSKWARDSDNNDAPQQWIMMHYFGIVNRFVRGHGYQWALSPGGVIAGDANERALGPVE